MSKRTCPKPGPTDGRLSSTAGLSPGSLVHVGRVRTPLTHVRVVQYDPTHATEVAIHDIAQLADVKTDAGITWIRVTGIADIKAIEAVGRTFNLHPMILEDVLNTEQRPKYEDLGEYVFFVLKRISRGTDCDTLESDQVSIVLGKGFVISFQEDDDDKDASSFGHVWQRIVADEGRIRTMGPDYLAYRLVDTVVDGYFAVLEQTEDQLEGLEDAVVLAPSPTTLQSVQLLKRDMIALRKSVWPVREVVGAMQRRESPLITEDTAVFLRDVYDHAIQIIDSIETLRDVMSSTLDIYLSSVSNRMNEVMKTLTIIATIFMPVTFLAGVYGMNLENIPELKLPWAYQAFWGVCIMTTLTMLAYFRRKKWL